MGAKRVASITKPTMIFFMVNAGCKQQQGDKIWEVTAEVPDEWQPGSNGAVGFTGITSAIARYRPTIASWSGTTLVWVV
jgi:hypothetical protein